MMNDWGFIFIIFVIVIIDQILMYDLRKQIKEINKSNDDVL